MNAIQAFYAHKKAPYPVYMWMWMWMRVCVSLCVCYPYERTVHAQRSLSLADFHFIIVTIIFIDFLLFIVCAITCARTICWQNIHDIRDDSDKECFLLCFALMCVVFSLSLSLLSLYVCLFAYVRECHTTNCQNKLLACFSIMFSLCRCCLPVATILSLDLFYSACHMRKQERVYKPYTVWIYRYCGYEQLIVITKKHNKTVGNSLGLSVVFSFLLLCFVSTSMSADMSETMGASEKFR